MGRENRFIGALGEEKARELLKRKGYKIFAENVRTRLGEIDLVARHKGFTVFVEVKTRVTSSLGPPYISVTRLKQRHMVICALSYLRRYNLMDSKWRIDVVSVKLNYKYGVENIEIIENAVEDNYV